MQSDFSDTAKPAVRFYFKDLAGPEYYDLAVNLFFDDLYQALLDGHLSAEELKGKINCQVVTFVHRPDLRSAEGVTKLCWVCKDYMQPQILPLTSPWLHQIADPQAIAFVDEMKRLQDLPEPTQEIGGLTIRKLHRGWADRSGTFIDHFAARGEHNKVASLMELGVGVASLHILVGSNNLVRVKEALAADPQLIHSRDFPQRTPLFYARTKEMFDLLMEFNPDVRVLDGFGDPFHYFYDSREFGSFPPAEAGLRDYAVSRTGIPIKSRGIFETADFQ